LYFLAKYPKYINKASIEVEKELEGKIPTFEDIQRLSLCNAIIKESLRLLPPFLNVKIIINKK
jgi:cytochrome P450